MQEQVKKIFFGNNTKFNGLLALTIVGLIILGCTCNKKFGTGGTTTETPTPTVSGTNNPFPTSTGSTSSELPPNSQVESLVKETVSELADAIESGDFSDLYAKSSMDFQATVKKEQLPTTYKSFLDQKKNVVPLLRKVGSMSAKFSAPPSLRTEKGLSILVANGNFATTPVPVRFEYEYVLRGGEWKLLKLVTNLTK